MASTQAAPFDLVLREAWLIDGRGTPAILGEIAVAGDRIAAVGSPGTIPAGAARAERRLGGRCVCPGFIDVHTHDDRFVLADPAMSAKVSQGVTTVVVGNCGISLAPLTLDQEPPPPLNLLGGRAHFAFPTFTAYAAAVEATRPAVNVAALVGHSSLRLGAMPDVTGKPTWREIDAMRERLAEGLAAGAIGFSTGLFYATNRSADIDEVVALAELLADAGGVYATHMRDEHAGVVQSLHETFETARRARVPVVVSHHKCAGPANWGRSAETLPIIEQARARQPIGLDAYPYTAGSTVLMPELVDETIRIMVTWSRSHPEMAARDLAEIAAAWGCSQREAAARLAPAGAVYFQMDEADVRRILAYPPTMIGSDGLPHDSHPHPRLWGTFPRVIGRYARDLGLFTVEEAVRKMTGLPAATFHLDGRGSLDPGCFADLVVFDRDAILDTATFEAPIQAASGIDLVLVNGAVAWRGGSGADERAGRFLRRRGS